MTGSKPDADEIVAIVDELVTQPWLRPNRQFWPQFLFHVTNVTNAVSILKTGRLLNRDEALRSGVMISDNANPEIIGQTDSETHQCARLYFRPRTPTFHTNEGIRPPNKIEKHSHCPMPVAFLFDSKTILCMSESRFSDGSLARISSGRRAERGSTADFLRRIPFEKVYHDRAFSQDEKDDIIFRRQAEVIIPGELAIRESLRRVYVRSVAEYETLRSLLADAGIPLSSARAKLISVNTHEPVFFKKWTYVERVSAVDQQVAFNFNASSQTPGPFSAVFEISDPNTGTISYRQPFRCNASGTQRFIVPATFASRPFTVRLYLDEILAYQSTFDPSRVETLRELTPEMG